MSPESEPMSRRAAGSRMDTMQRASKVDLGIDTTYNDVSRGEICISLLADWCQPRNTKPRLKMKQGPISGTRSREAAAACACRSTTHSQSPRLRNFHEALGVGSRSRRNTLDQSSRCLYCDDFYKIWAMHCSCCFDHDMGMCNKVSRAASREGPSLSQVFHVTQYHPCSSRVCEYAQSRHCSSTRITSASSNMPAGVSKKRSSSTIRILLPNPI